MEYLGIAADEPARFGQLNERKRAPLVEFGIEEGLCGLYCQYDPRKILGYMSSEIVFQQCLRELGIAA